MKRFPHWRLAPPAAIGLPLIALLVTGCMPTRWEQPAPTAPEPVAVAQPAIMPVPGVIVPPSPVNRSALGNPPFYEVFGQRYYVLPDGRGFREQGVASWYGKKFHGRQTSSGVIYDMHRLTAAHRTLPLPTSVRVTNLANGRSVVVTVNDRGPFAHNRVIDLSYAAAQALDMVDAGVAEVSIEALMPEPEGGEPAAVPLHHVYAQVGAFDERANAAALKERLATAGVDNVVIRYDASTGRGIYRVRVGPIDAESQFDALAARLAALDIGGPQLVAESPQPADPLPSGP